MKKKLILGTLICSFMVIGVGCTKDSGDLSKKSDTSSIVDTNSEELLGELPKEEKDKIKLETESRLKEFEIDYIDILTATDGSGAIVSLQIKTGESDLDAFSKTIESKISDLGKVEIIFLDRTSKVIGIYSEGSLQLT